MKKATIIISVVLLFSQVLLASTGDLEPKSLSPPSVEGASLVKIYYTCMVFAPRTEGDGTVNKNALIGAVNMAGKTVKIAVDARSADANRPEVIRFDFSGAGKFDDTNVVAIEAQGQPQSDYFYGNFAGKNLVFELNGKKVPIYVEGRYYRSGMQRQIHFTTSTCLVGTCDFGGKIYPVTIIDGNGNFKIGDVTRQSTDGGRINGDIVIVGDANAKKQETGSEVHFLDQPILVDGKWYMLKLAADGSKVSAEPAVVATGEIKTVIPVTSATITLAGKKNFLIARVSEKPTVVPADQYSVLQYSEIIPGANVMLMPLAKPVTLDVPAGRVTEIPLGKTLIATLGITTSDDRVTFVLTEKDESGMRAMVYPVVTSGDSQPKETAKPVVVVYDSGGKEVYKAALEYG